MKLLHLRTTDGRQYVVNKAGMIVQLERLASAGFSGEWIFSGTSSHHWHNRITERFCFDNPERFLKGYVWDVDHGTTRRWNRRVSSAYVSERE